MTTTCGARGKQSRYDSTGFGRPAGRASVQFTSGMRAAGAAGPPVILQPAARCAVEPLRWLWKDHFALGKLAVVAGAAEVGDFVRQAADMNVPKNARQKTS